MNTAERKIELNTELNTELKALIFDVDGTLADTEEAHRQAFNDTFAQQGLAWKWPTEEYCRLLDVTGGKERINHYIKTSAAEVPAGVSDLQIFIAELHARKTSRYQELIAQGELRLRPGVKRIFLEARQAGLRLAIATTTSLVNVKTLIDINLGEEAMSWFTVIGAGEHVTQKKPQPEVYEYVMQQMQLEPSECIALEDTHNGLMAASGANLACVITVNDFSDKQNFAGAAIVLDQFGEPGQGFSVLQGDAAGHEYVNVAMLRHLHRQNQFTP